MSLKWGKSNPPELFNSLDEALKIAKQRNKNLLENISILPITLDHKETIKIKVNKELQKKERLVNEEKLMLQEAQRRAKTKKKPEINKLILPERSEKFRQTLYAQLSTIPYLKRVLVSEKNKQFILERSKENELKWSQPISAKKKAIEYTYKATIAEGFDLDPEAHWGKTKATIRDLLLPKANKLLQLASVQRLLAEAKLKGQFVLVSNGYVFWYEEDGNIGWTIKQTDSTLSNNKGNTCMVRG